MSTTAIYTKNLTGPFTGANPINFIEIDGHKPIVDDGSWANTRNLNGDLTDCYLNGIQALSCARLANGGTSTNGVTKSDSFDTFLDNATQSIGRIAINLNNATNDWLKDNWTTIGALGCSVAAGALTAGTALAEGFLICSMAFTAYDISKGSLSATVGGSCMVTTARASNPKVKLFGEGCGVMLDLFAGSGLIIDWVDRVDNEFSGGKGDKKSPGNCTRGRRCGR